MRGRETDGLHSLIKSVFLGRGDILIAPIDTTCMFGKGIGTLITKRV